MSDKLFYPFVVGLCLMAIGTSSKAIIDVAVLKEQNISSEKKDKEIIDNLRDMRTEIREIKNYLLTSKE